MGLLSMTGYGRGRVCRDGREMVVELKSVNHRFLDASYRLPRSLPFLEETLRVRVGESTLRRGHVDVTVSYANAREDASTVIIDRAMLRRSAAEIGEAARELPIAHCGRAFAAERRTARDPGRGGRGNPCRAGR